MIGTTQIYLKVLDIGMLSRIKDASLVSSPGMRSIAYRYAPNGKVPNQQKM